jgi:predicted nucleic acid-binding protein
VIVLDTSILIDALTEARPLAGALDRVLGSGERIRLPAPVLYEWLRGTRKPRDLEVQRYLFPDERAIVFGPAEARVAADLYRILPRARGRETDIAIAACVLTREGRLWTTNEKDFRDIPGLSLFDGTAA